MRVSDVLRCRAEYELLPLSR